MSFHLGTSSSTIDLDKELTADQITRVEETVNNVLWEDREVCVKFVTAHEAAKLPLRKDSVRSGELRIIEIKDYDLSACGGTHVRRTGAIGVIAIAGFERFKGGLRVEFLCGHRALRAYRTLRGSIAEGVRLLSVLPDELPSAIEKLQIAGRNHQKSQESLYGRLAAHEAALLAASGEQVGSVTVVASAVSGWDANGLKKLASAIVSRPSTIAVLVTSESPSLVVVSRSEDLVDRHRFGAPAVARSLRRQGWRQRRDGAGRRTDGEAQEILKAARERIGQWSMGNRQRSIGTIVHGSLSTIDH